MADRHCADIRPRGHVEIAGIGPQDRQVGARIATDELGGNGAHIVEPDAKVLISF